MDRIKAIETVYKGYRFRSRLEARWAVFLDVARQSWEYESEGYNLDGVRYLPDFWLPSLNLWLEVKGDRASDEDEAKVEALRQQSAKPVLIAWGQIGNHYWDTGSFEPSVHIESDRTSAELVAALSKPTETYAPDKWGAIIHCPFCGSNFCHFQSPIEIATDNYKAWQGRGSAIRIPMWCEEGHSWTVRIGFHKGNSYIAIEDMQTADIDLYLAGGNFKRLEMAVRAAKQARFEHGEIPLAYYAFEKDYASHSR